MRRRLHRPALVLAATAVAVGGFAAAGALAGIRGVDSLLTTTIGPQPPSTTTPKPDPPPPKPKPPPPPPPAPPPPPPPAPPPPAPTPPPPPPVSPPPPPVVVTPPPPAPPPPPPPAPVKPRHVKKHVAKKPSHRRQAVVAPAPWSRGSGGPPGAVDWIPPSAPYLSGAVLAASTSISADSPQSSHAGLFLLAAGALGLLLLVGSMLPSPAIRPSVVHNVVVVHRIDLALVGGAILVLAGILRLVGG
jgi:hypothetical protein